MCGVVEYYSATVVKLLLKGRLHQQYILLLVGELFPFGTTGNVLITDFHMKLHVQLLRENSAGETSELQLRMEGWVEAGRYRCGPAIQRAG